MEYVSNGNLRDFLRDRRRSQNTQERGHLLNTHILTTFALQIATGLEFLASKNVSNFFVFF